jgi:DNA-binding MarR family transcriptional regulator
MTTPLALELTREILATSDALLRASQVVFKPLGLTAVQFNVLTVLARAPKEGMTQRELSEALVVDRSNVTGLLDRLEKAGWTQRGEDARDRRVWRVSLTSAGRKIWAKASPHYEAAAGLVTAGLAEAQARAALAVLRSLQTATARLAAGETSA